MNAPAIPIVTALRIDGMRTPFAKPNTITPAINEAIYLWSLRIGTESNTELIRGTKNGAIKLADITAITLSSNTAPFIDFKGFEATVVTDIWKF